MTTVTVPLSSPITHGDKTLSELTFREAETGDVMLAEKFEGYNSKSIVMLSSMADIPLPIFKKIKLRDLNTILEQTAELMGESKPTTTGD